jgi:hypothetical protein
VANINNMGWSSCPCCICAQNKVVDCWIPRSEELQIFISNRENETKPKEAVEQRNLVYKAASPAIRSLRISMDGNINEHNEDDGGTETSSICTAAGSHLSDDEQQQQQQQQHHVEDSLGSPSTAMIRPFRRATSMETHDILPNSEEPPSRVQSMPPPVPSAKATGGGASSTPPQERPRCNMRRRCSITKFSLESTFQQIQIEDIATEYGNTEDTPPVSAPPPAVLVVERKRMKRRCSVTKFNLEQENHSTTPQDDASKHRITTLSHQHSYSSTSSLVQLLTSKDFPGTGLVLAATPESKRTFQAKKPWGRAA